MEEFNITHEPMPVTNTKEFSLEDIDQIYLGKGNCCRCGCGGTYAYSDNPSLIKRRMKRFMELYSDGYIGRYVKVKSIDDYIFEIDASQGSGNDKVITIYLKRES